METQPVKKLKVFGVPWHLGHQYELNRLSFTDWSWLLQYKRKYSDKVRGDFMKNWVLAYEPGKYDVAVLHLDQQCIEDSILDRGKGSVYRELNELITDIPKIVIQHGTPYYPEKFSSDEIIERTKALVGDNTMIVNSHRAAEQWGWGTPIIHGMKKEEWWDLPKEPRVVTMISPGGLDKYYDRQFFAAVKDMLEEESIILAHITVDWVGRDWDDYREFLGRSLIFFNPTRESPMPRSRTEAMLSGCCVITTPHHDADTFIEHGTNGLICKRNPRSVVDMVKWCIDNYDDAIKIGQNGKKTAEALFTFERFEEDWKKIMSEVTGKEL